MSLIICPMFVTHFLPNLEDVMGTFAQVCCDLYDEASSTHRQEVHMKCEQAYVWTMFH